MLRLLGHWRLVQVRGLVVLLAAAPLGLTATHSDAQPAAGSPLGREIVVAAPAFWCPYSCVAGAAREGFTVDILRAIFEPQGIRVRLINKNYGRALQDIREGVHAASPLSFMEEAPDFVFPKSAIALTRYCVYLPGGSTWTYAGPDSLDGLRVGIVKGYSYGAALDRSIAGRRARFTVSAGEDITRRLARMVMARRLDAFIEDESVVDYTLAANPDLKLHNSGCEPPHLAYFALSPARPTSAADARSFDEGIKRLRTSGELERILAVYGLQDRLAQFERRERPER